MCPAYNDFCATSHDMQEIHFSGFPGYFLMEHVRALAIGHPREFLS